MLLVLLAGLVLTGLEWWWRALRPVAVGPYQMMELEPEMSVVSSGGPVAVAGRAAVFDSPPGHDFLWSLRVYQDTPGRQPVLHDRYPAQLAGKSRAQRLIFRHSVVLPPGRYWVRLHLYAARPGFDFRLLTDGEARRDRYSPGTDRNRVVVEGQP